MAFRERDGSARKIINLLLSKGNVEAYVITHSIYMTASCGGGSLNETKKPLSDKKPGVCWEEYASVNVERSAKLT